MSNRKSLRRVVVLTEPPKSKGFRQATRQDTAYFNAHPDAREYTRPYVPGETPQALPYGTTVIVRRLGAHARVRAFVAPQQEGDER